LRNILSTAALALLLASTLVASQKPTQGKISVFVMSATDANGFIIPALGDSANDLLGKIGGKWLDKGQTEEGSDLVVVVTNRFFQGSGIVKSDYNPYSHTLTSGEMQLRIVTIRIVTRDNASTDAYGYDATSWRSAANGAKKVFEQFAEANYQKIVSLRGR
jgi:hypothetical protein